MADERGRAAHLGGHLPDQLGGRLENLVAAGEPVVVVVGLEVVEVRVQQGERGVLGEAPLQLLLDADVPGQAGKRGLRPQLVRPPQHAPNPGQQLRGVERLDDVVVGPGGEPLELSGGARGGDEDDADPGSARVAP